MEKASSFVSGSGLKLPIGFRFRPTDEELVVHYLRRKALGIPFPASVVPELDVFQADPWGLPGDLREKRHFFSNKPERNLCGRGRIRGIAAAGSGCWKVSSKSKRIFASENGNQAIGMRKTLVFREGKHSNRHARSGLAKWP